MITIPKNNIEAIDSLANSFVMTAMRLEALTERYLFKPSGLSAASFKILAFIKNRKECSPSEILDYLGGTKSNITQRLNFLERLSLVSASKSKEGDKRKVLVCLSKTGEERLAEVMGAFRKNRIHFEKFFTKQEIHNHLSFMLKLNHSLDQAEEMLKNCQCALHNK